MKKMLADYQAPALDPATNEALHDYVARKKAAEPDSFM
jgi:trimethylamine--corrinoid protein Co-methyltransferase